MYRASKAEARILGIHVCLKAAFIGSDNVRTDKCSNIPRLARGGVISNPPSRGPLSQGGALKSPEASRLKGSDLNRGRALVNSL